jgi:hypothetical protein
MTITLLFLSVFAYIAIVWATWAIWAEWGDHDSGAAVSAGLLWPLFWAFVAVTYPFWWVSTRPYRVRTRPAYRLFGSERLRPSLGSRLDMITNEVRYCDVCCRKRLQEARYCPACGKRLV